MPYVNEVSFLLSGGLLPLPALYISKLIFKKIFDIIIIIKEILDKITANSFGYR